MDTGACFRQLVLSEEQPAEAEKDEAMSVEANHVRKEDCARP